MLKYLVDENLSKSDKFLEQHPDFANVKYVLYMGAKDPMIIQKALEDDLIIVTKDNALALKALIAGAKVWYFDAADSNQDYKLVAHKFD